MIDRFMDKVVPDPNSGCWLWDAATRGEPQHDYGVFWLNGKGVAAHRASYEIHIGPIPGGMCVLHRCDTRHCVNPRHLFVGTVDDNNRDSRTKGRHQHGVGHHSAKLVDADAVEIRRRAAHGESHRGMAREYGVAPSTIDRLVQRKTWRHV